MSAAKMSINPATPAKHLYRRSSDFQDSPFSDYFSEDGRSVYTTCASDETKQLLVRMNRLQSQLMRDQSGDRHKAIAVVARKLGEMEEELSKLNDNATSNLDDSAVFIDEPVEERKSTSEPAVSSTPSTPSRKSSATGRTHVSKPSMNDSVMEATQTFTYEQIKAERDSLAVRLQGLSEGLNTVQGELTQRYAEVRKLNNLHNEERERYEQHVEKLRSENEGLRSDLGFEYSELLYLKLQMKSLEVDIDNIPDEDIDPRHATIADLRRARAKRARRNRILSEMDRWRTDWQDVSTRFKRRRNRYGVPTSPIVEFEGHEFAAEWHLETVREARGHATCLTIKRIEGPPVRELTALREEIVDPDVLRLAEAKVFKGYIDQGAQTEMSAADYMHVNFDEAETDSFFDHEYPALDELEDIDCDDAIPSKRDFAIRAVGEDDEEEEEEEEEEEGEDDDIHPQPKEPTGSAPPPPTHTTLPSNSSRSAWQELWASLASLSGLPDDDEDDF
ncbi:unnamed protein product [Zymoseptoria tritici ST99CH_1A5]|uniref:Uncharacterized protein n=1 Tax=Zymoseptoria tritici ST99CH_1A5 TaxID=1276529 RepID=A0A1Y6LKQ0_ZYMTR|nr:unnamed protein product [Zymoseptoria tritici ST99CH_1A5]